MIEPHAKTGMVYVLDDIGLLVKLTPDAARRAYEEGQVEPHERPGYARLVEQPIRQMTPEEKRQREIDKQKALRERQGRRGRRR